MDKENYLSSGGVVCPFCESKEVEGTGGVEVDAGIAWQEIKCNECDKTWRDMYKLVDVIET